MVNELSNQMADAVAGAAPSVVQVQGRRRPVSGLVYAEDIVLPPILAYNGAIAVFDGPGLGVEPVEERILVRTLRSFVVKT